MTNGLRLLLPLHVGVDLHAVAQVVCNRRVDIPEGKGRVLCGDLLGRRPFVERLDDGFQCYLRSANPDDAGGVFDQR